MMNLILEVKSRKSNIEVAKHRNNTFHGELSGNSFEIRRMIKVRNDFQPKILGEFTDTIRGTEVSIVMKLKAQGYAFMALWFGGLSFAIFNIIHTEDSSIFKLIIPVLMIIGGYLMFTIGFGVEANKAEKELMRIFDEQNDNYEKLSD